MPEEFVSLAASLRAGSAVPASGPDPSATANVPAARAERLSVAHDDPADDDDCAQAATIRELMLMRLAASEAYERAAATLLASFASDVLGRELALAPADVAALARTVIVSRGDEPVTIVLSAEDAERVRTALPVRVDRSLAAGDLIVEVHDGALESSLSFRIAAVLERNRPVVR